MTSLSVNINKLATLRNARGENNPSLPEWVELIESYGANGITVHPRPDERHIRRRDVDEIRHLVRGEFNIEGYPSEDFMELVRRARPQQVTLVPDAPQAVTSNHGWNVVENEKFLSEIVERLHDMDIRASIFVNPDEEQIEAAARTGTDRVELYTKPYADAYAKDAKAAVEPFARAASRAKNLGLGVNAGHDLSLENLRFFHQNVPFLSEVSIGHALVCDALRYGMETTVQKYLDCLK